MEPLKLTPEQIAGKVRKSKPTDMDIIPLLTSFKGRIGRKQFLIWYIPIWLVSLVIGFFDTVYAGYYSLITLYPLFALTTKRCHDLGTAGWFGLLQLIPGIGWIVVTCTGCGMAVGDFNDNRYGESIYKR